MANQQWNGMAVTALIQLGKKALHFLPLLIGNHQAIYALVTMTE